MNRIKQIKIFALILFLVFPFYSRGQEDDAAAASSTGSAAAPAKGAPKSAQANTQLRTLHIAIHKLGLTATEILAAGNLDDLHEKYKEALKGGGFKAFTDHGKNMVKHGATLDEAIEHGDLLDIGISLQDAKDHGDLLRQNISLEDAKLHGDAIRAGASLEDAKKYKDLVLSDIFFDGKNFPMAILDTKKFSYTDEDEIEIEVELSIKGKNHMIPLIINIIQLAEEVVQIQSELIFSRNSFNIGTGNWRNTTILKDNVKLNTNIFLFKE